MHTDAFNHAPAQILMSTGSQQFGRPSLGSWVSYGLGSENDNGRVSRLLRNHAATKASIKFAKVNPMAIPIVLPVMMFAARLAMAAAMTWR